MTTALITGGTSGIGAAFARALAARGTDLVLVARDSERLRRCADELIAAHQVRVETITADLADLADVEAVAARLEDAERPVDLLVNNAGFGLHSGLLDPDWSIHQEALQVMCLAVLILGGAAGRAMKARGHGKIANISSLASWIAQGHYSPVKAWVRSYSEGLAAELHNTGVSVTAVCPGWVKTEFHQRAGIRTSAIPGFVWVDVDRMAAKALADIDAGKAISIPAKRWKVAAFLARHAPRSAVGYVSRMLARSRA
ncbi:MAG: SDR family NAD(P)-dependent oxidoreductase [Propionibacteriaceae bacterium]|jgi:short-subunit dehydrogenase|nr:SDR family NAD(P)-dependent oxidoreductase [Propionibacteriaceae bacterium]